MNERYVRTFGVISFAVLVIALPACKAESRPDPEAQYRQLAANFQSGQLTAAYAGLFPKRYDHELNVLLSEVGALLDPPQYEQLRATLQELGAYYGKLLELGGDGPDETPIQSLLGTKLTDLPSILGIATYDDFRTLSSQRILNSIEKGFFLSLIHI